MTRRHARYLLGLQRAALADADTVGALCSLTDADRAWLNEQGWEEPRHAHFVRINNLTLNDLPLPKSRLGF